MRTIPRLVRKLAQRGWYSLNQHLHRRIVRARLDTPIISFTFDDFPRSAYRQAGPILRDYDARGTYYAALGLMNTATKMGDMFDMADLVGLIDDGHELACHGFGHTVCSEVSCSEYKRDVLRNAKEVAAALRGYKLRNFSYPHGDAPRTHKAAIFRYFRSMRGTRDGINAGRIDLDQLRANRLYSDTTALNHVEELIRENDRLCGWLVFYTHDVCDEPSPFGCTPQFFEEATRLAAKSQSRILTVDQAVDCLV